MRAPKEPEYGEHEERPAFIEPTEQRGPMPERRGPAPERIGPMEERRFGVAEAPMPESRDLSRWGPIWAGFLATIGTIILLGTLGAAVGLAITGTIGLTANSIWAGIVLLLGLFLGGWLAARLAAVGGRLLGLVQGSLVWALTIFLSLILTVIGAGAALGAFLGGFAPAVAGAGVTPGAGSTALWLLFGTLLLGLIAAALGGWIGARSTYEAPPR